MNATSGTGSTGGARIKVVLVDDVPELRLLVKLTLEEDGDIEVVGEASNGREGVEVLRACEPDVVLLDLSMPDMDGLEAIPLMRDAAPGARLVVLSGHEAGRISLEALHQGATRYVNKATGLESVKRIVREVAAMEPPFTDARFGVLREAWEAFLQGEVDRITSTLAPDARWRPYIAQGQELRSREECRAFIVELMRSGRVVDPRPYGVEPHDAGLVVRGTLEVRGPGGFSETELFWAVCFSGPRIAFAGGFDDYEEAVRTLAVCAA